MKIILSLTCDECSIVEWELDNETKINVIISILSMILICTAYQDVPAFYETDPNLVSNNIWYFDTKTVGIKQGDSVWVIFLVIIQLISIWYVMKTLFYFISCLTIGADEGFKIKNCFVDSKYKFGVFFVVFIYNMIGGLIYSSQVNSDKIRTTGNFIRIMGSQFDLFPITLSSLVCALSSCMLLTGDLSNKIIIHSNNLTRDISWVMINSHIDSERGKNKSIKLKDVIKSYTDKSPM